MAVLFNVGLLDCDEVDDDRFEWIVYWYNYENWEGSGEAIGLHKKDRTLWCIGLGHCSCYGPMDCDWTSSGGRWNTASILTIEAYFEPRDSVHDLEPMSDIDKKVRELLLQMQPKPLSGKEAEKAKLRKLIRYTEDITDGL